MVAPQDDVTAKGLVMEELAVVLLSLSVVIFVQAATTAAIAHLATTRVVGLKGSFLMFLLVLLLWLLQPQLCFSISWMLIKALEPLTG